MIVLYISAALIQLSASPVLMTVRTTPPGCRTPTDRSEIEKQRPPRTLRLRRLLRRVSPRHRAVPAHPRPFCQPGAPVPRCARLRLTRRRSPRPLFQETAIDECVARSVASPGVRHPGPKNCACVPRPRVEMTLTAPIIRSDVQGAPMRGIARPHLKSSTWRLRLVRPYALHCRGPVLTSADLHSDPCWNHRPRRVVASGAGHPGG